MEYIKHKVIHGGFGLVLKIALQDEIEKVMLFTTEGCSHHPSEQDLTNSYKFGFDGKLDIKARAIPSVEIIRDETENLPEDVIFMINEYINGWKG